VTYCILRVSDCNMECSYLRLSLHYSLLKGTLEKHVCDGVVSPCKGGILYRTEVGIHFLDIRRWVYENRCRFESKIFSCGSISLSINRICRSFKKSFT
jgi:hypothetical protein